MSAATASTDRGNLWSTGTPAAAAPVRLVHERIPAAPDSDTATAQTIAKMTEYIRDAAQDPEVQRCARYALKHFGWGQTSLQMRAWAAFWWTKHCIKFRLDEGTMLQLGEHDQQDLLISPSVLVRMKKAEEDCDGFSMMETALLTCLGVPWVLLTVAVDPREPGRWSHVFPCALLPDGPLPLDASHGAGPGFMVPPDRINRLQAWDAAGRPVDDVKLASKKGLNGYVRSRGYGRRGMGDMTAGMCIDATTGDSIPCPDFGGGAPTSTTNTGSFGSTGGWTFLSNLISTAGQVASKALTPLQTITYPGGTTVTGPAGSVPSSAFGSGLSSIGPIGWVGIGLIAFLALRGKR